MSYNPKLESPGATVPVPIEFAKFRVETRLVRSKVWDPELDVIISSPDKVAEIARKIEGSDRERILVLYLDRGNRLVGIQELSIGERSAAMIAPDAIYRMALLTNSSGFILIHNHPGGSVSFSEEDKGIAHKLRDGARLMDMELLDFVVVADGLFKSLRKEGEL